MRRLPLSKLRHARRKPASKGSSRAATVPEVRSVRRYYLLRARFFDSAREGELALAYYGKQELQPGTPISGVLAPALLDQLSAAHYRALEDLDGADVEELVDQGIARSDAAAVLSALGLSVCGV